MTATHQDPMAFVGQIIGHATGMMAIRLCAIGDPAAPSGETANHQGSGT